MKNVDDKYVSLVDYPNAKGFVVIFTCKNSPYAKAYQDRIIALDKEYKAKGFPVIAINTNNPAVEPGDSYDASGKLIVKYIGALDDNYQDAAAVKVPYIENAINALFSGKDPEPKTTKAIGCSIKSKPV